MNSASLNCACPTECVSSGLVSKISVDKAKFNQLDCRPVGDVKLISTSFVTDDGTQGSLNQNYFRGLVYRYDSRNLSVIKEAGGFYPRVPKDDKSQRLLATDVIKRAPLLGFTCVVSRYCPGAMYGTKLEVAPKN